MKQTDVRCGLTVTAPNGAIVGLYSGVPSGKNYFKAISPENAILPTATERYEGRISHFYENLSAGIYHYAASMEGHTAVCQIINYTEDKAKSSTQIDVQLSKLSGDGYESGFVMLNSKEFIEANLATEKTVWRDKYPHLFVTPRFTRPENYCGKHKQTTNEEMYAFIEKLSQSNKNMYVFSLGKSPKYGFDMPLVLFTQNDVSGSTLQEAAEIIRGNGKPTVQYTAEIHANEPAST